MEGLISVIVPIYNKEKYLKDCIESILEQSYSNLEILLMNDGSTDHSKEICEEYSQRDLRIKLISTENRGAARARNAGIELAKGEYLSFIDADDYIEKHYYEIMLEQMRKYNADIVECGLERVEEGTDYSFPKKMGKARVMSREETLIELYGKEDEEHVKTVIMCNKLFKRKLFDTVRYIPGRVIDDETIIYRLIEQCGRVVELEDRLYAYVQSSNSIMRKDFSMKRLDDSIAVYDECIEHFKKEPNIQACCIKRAIFFYGEFIQRIASSNQINKVEAIHKVKEKFEEKKKQYEQLRSPIKQEIHVEQVIRDYEKNLEQYTG